MKCQNTTAFWKKARELSVLPRQYAQNSFKIKEKRGKNHTNNKHTSPEIV